jgi:hypothetical protein
MSNTQRPNNKKKKSHQVGAIRVPTIFLERFMGAEDWWASTTTATRCRLVGVFRVNPEEKNVVNVIISGRTKKNVQACLGELKRRLVTINNIATTINSKGDTSGAAGHELQSFLNPHHSGCQCCEEN